MVKAPLEASLQQRVERLLTGVAERRVAEIVPEADRLDEVLVQPQCAGDAARDPGRLERVGEPGAVMVAGRIDEDLGLVHQPSEGLRVHDAVAVALKRRAQEARLLRLRPPARLEGAHRKRREPPLFVLANARLEGVCGPSGEFRHRDEPR